MTHSAKVLEVDYELSDVIGKFLKWLIILKQNQLGDTSWRTYGAFIFSNLQNTISNQFPISYAENMAIGCEFYDNSENTHWPMYLNRKE